jgi:hypothetical protein
MASTKKKITKKKTVKKAPTKTVARTRTITRYFVNKNGSYYPSPNLFRIEDKEETRQINWGGAIEKRKSTVLKTFKGRTPSNSICGWGIRSALGTYLCQPGQQVKVTVIIEPVK